MLRTYLQRLTPLTLLLFVAADWPQFRGPTSGVADETAPTQFDAESLNVGWKVELPGTGISSPAIKDGRVYVTACNGDKLEQLHVQAFDASTGTRLWKDDFLATGPTRCHKATTTAAPTPALDGTHVVALFGTNDCVCFDINGKKLWHRPLGKENPEAHVGHGMASSPLIVDDVVVIQLENPDHSFACGLDIKTGKDRWKIERPKDRNWSSPVLLGDGLVLFQGKLTINAIEAATGKEVWKLDHQGDEKASSSVQDGVLYIPGKGGLTAYRLKGRVQPEELWRSGRLGPQVASPVIVGDRVFVLRGSALVRGDAKTGEELARTRVNGKFSSSLVAAGGVIYCTNEDGLIYAIRPREDRDDDEIIGESRLRGPMRATPSVADGALYFRGDGMLWKISDTEKTATSRPNGQ